MPKLRLSLRPRQDVLDLDLWRRTRLAAAILSGVFVYGTIGYLILGLSFVDAVYQTIVTVSTVGFREIGEVTSGYKIFTMSLIVVGAGTVLYTIGTLLETVIEGRITQEFGRRRMERDIDSVQDHIIVCGWGQVGRAITETLVKEGRQVVVIDRDDVMTASCRLFVVGDATDDGVLAHAGIDRAAALVVALDSAADNVYVVLSGRATNPHLFIVARGTSASDERKLFHAGADRVVNPHQLGGAHMAALVTQPNVAEYLDIAMHDRELSFTIAEVPVPTGSPITNQALRDCELGDAVVLAVRQRDGRFVHHPGQTLVALPGDILIVLGTDDDHRELRRRIG